MISNLGRIFITKLKGGGVNDKDFLGSLFLGGEHIS
jgi:hypothetical protein